jgi:hypothetical protein
MKVCQCLLCQNFQMIGGRGLLKLEAEELWAIGGPDQQYVKVARNMGPMIALLD